MGCPNSLYFVFLGFWGLVCGVSSFLKLRTKGEGLSTISELVLEKRLVFLFLICFFCLVFLHFFFSKWIIFQALILLEMMMISYMT
jgi:hypothetical protein